MATREENLKKINEQLEKLSDEELEKVAGGNCYETSDDSLFLNSLNGSTKRYGHGQVFFAATDDMFIEIEDAWAKLGITAKVDPGKSDPNKYYLNGKEITQEQARQHAMKVTGHYMSVSDWKH